MELLYAFFYKYNTGLFCFLKLVQYNEETSQIDITG